MDLKENIRQILKRLPFPLSKNHLYDIQTRKILRKVCKENTICVDVGSHRGEVLEWMIKFAPSAKHYAFEPIPKYAKFLESKFGKISHIYPVALADKESTTDFHFVRSNPSYSGIKKRRYDRPDEKVEIISVKMKPMDSIIPDSEKIGFIKIDVEGAEYWVFKGGIQTIRNGKPIIVFETGEGGLDHYDLGPSELFDLLNDQLEYEISTLDSWLKNGLAMNKSEFINQFEKALNYYFVASPIRH